MTKVADHHGEIIAIPHTAAMAAKLKTEQGEAAYRRRKAIVEAPNGWIRAVTGFRQFGMRGIDVLLMIYGMARRKG
ncbi:hypothetical protein CS8_003250 [Cupriavidus sp. 8B]